MVKNGQKIHHRALFLFHSPICAGGAFISDSLSCFSEVHASAQMFVILKMRSSLREALQFVNEQRHRPVPCSFLSGCLAWIKRSGVFPSHSCAQMELYFDQSVVCG